jgi:purine-binding chemotaxis protein CheW
MHIEEILIIKDNDIFYGIDTKNIDQILRVPALTPVVLTSDAIRGLSAVSGNIVTVFDLNMLLGLQAINIELEETRLLSLTGEEQSSALLVSEVADTVWIKDENMEFVEESDDAVMALYKHEDEIIQILDIAALHEDVTLPSYNLFDVKDGNSRRSQETKRPQDSERYLYIQMASEKYAINIDTLREIIALPESFTEIAGSRDEILGMMPLRDELLLVADLRKFFSFEYQESDKNRILVANYDGQTMGLVVDEILDIQEVEKDKIDEMPANFEDKKLSGVIHDDEQLISLIGDDVLKQLFDASKSLTQQDNLNTQGSEEEKNVALEVVAFTLGSEEYAINIDDVVEIIDATPVTPLKDAPAFVDGVINIRGQVVTIMSVYEWLNKPMSEDEEQKIIICQINDYRIGFFVDSVSDVMEIESNQIKEEKEQSEFFTNVLYLDDGTRLVLLFDIHKLSETKDAA